MRIGRQSVALDFLAETQQLTLIERPSNRHAVDSGTRMSLHEDHVSGMRGTLGAPKMIEATSYSVAADAYEAMWPPYSEVERFACTTMASAFQRYRPRCAVPGIDRRIIGLLRLGDVLR